MSYSRSPIAGAELLFSSSRTPGPLGFNDAADPTKMMCLAGDSPGPLGTGADFASEPAGTAKHDNHCLVFDLPLITEFFHSVGAAISRQAHIRVEWKEYKSTSLMDLLYALTANKPGTVTVVEGQKIEVDERADVETSRMLTKFLEKCSEGPRPAIEYLANADKVRQLAIQGVQDAYKDAMQINQQILQELNRSIRTAATIKFGSDLVVAGLGLIPAAGLASTGVSFVYSVATDLVQGKEADTVIVDRGGTAARDAAIQSADKAIIPEDLKKLGRWSAEAKILEHEELITKYEGQAIGKGANKRARLATRVTKHQAAKARLEKATSGTRRGTSNALKGLSIVFAAKNVIDSARELNEIWEETK